MLKMITRYLRANYLTDGAECGEVRALDVIATFLLGLSICCSMKDYYIQELQNILEFCSPDPLYPK